MDGGELVNMIARWFQGRVPASVSFDDLVQEGCMGLLKARAAYVPGHSSFDTYAGYRIRGAIKDYLRDKDDLSRTQRKHAKAGYVLDRIDRTMPWCTDPVECELPGTSGRIERAMARLSVRERYVLQRQYWDGVPGRLIADELHVTESRVCQVRAEALGKLRRFLT